MSRKRKTVCVVDSKRWHALLKLEEVHKELQKSAADTSAMRNDLQAQLHDLKREASKLRVEKMLLSEDLKASHHLFGHWRFRALAISTAWDQASEHRAEHDEAFAIMRAFLLAGGKMGDGPSIAKLAHEHPNVTIGQLCVVGEELGYRFRLATEKGPGTALKFNENAQRWEVKP